MTHVENLSDKLLLLSFLWRRFKVQENNLRFQISDECSQCSMHQEATAPQNVSNKTERNVFSSQPFTLSAMSGYFQFKNFTFILCSPDINKLTFCGADVLGKSADRVLTYF